MYGLVFIPLALVINFLLAKFAFGLELKSISKETNALIYLISFVEAKITKLQWKLEESNEN